MIHHQAPEEGDAMIKTAGHIVFAHALDVQDHPEPVSNRLTFALFAAGCVVLGGLVYLAWSCL